MPAPPARNFSFTDWQVNNPTAPPPGDQLDSNFDLTNLAITQQLAWASISLNSDGTIRDGIIDQNNLVPGLFDQVSQDIIDDVQPLVTEAQSYASQAQISATNAEAEATSAAAQAANAATSRDAAQVAAAEAEGSETAAALAETAATNAKVAAETAAGTAMGSEDQAMLFADLAGAWAEHMPDTIPPDVLAVNAITGDHWSSRWWANAAAQAFGNAAWYYAGAGPVPPITTATGDPLPIGAIWFDTSIPPGTIRIWNGTDWIAAAPSSLPPNSIATIHLQDGCVTNPKLATNAVDARVLADGAVDTAALQDGSVTSAKIQNGTIDPVDLNAATLALIATANPFDQLLNTNSNVRFNSVGISRAPEAWGGYKALAIGLGGAIAGDIATGLIATTSNLYYDGANWKLVNAGTGGAYFSGGGEHAWSSTLTGAAGGVVAVTERMRLNASGNLGIGRSPEAWGATIKGLAFGIVGSLIGPGGPDTVLASNLWSDGVSWHYIAPGGGAFMDLVDGQIYWSIAPVGAAGAVAVPVEKMRLDRNGNLGLRAVPNSLWHPNSVAITPGGSGSIIGQVGTPYMWMAENAYFDAASNFCLASAAPGGAYAQIQGLHIWQTFPTGAVGSVAALKEVMRLDGNGRLGLGVTPQAWAANYKTVSIGPQGSIFAVDYAGQTNTALQFSNNAFFDGSTWRAVISKPSALYGLQDGAHVWYSNSAGIPAAGAPFNFAERMKLQPNGWLVLNNFPPVFNGVGPSLTASTVVQLAGGLIMQSGYAFVGINDIVLPLTFPNALMGCWASVAQSTGVGGATLIAVTYPSGNSHFGISANTSASYNFNWFAIGY
jgi:hypothetical protein